MGAARLTRLPAHAASRPRDRHAAGHAGHPLRFTTTYFHRPEEIADAGLTLVDLMSVEGMAHWVPDITERLSDPDKRAVLLELLERTEREPAILGGTAHLLAVARKTA